MTPLSPEAVREVAQDAFDEWTRDWWNQKRGGSETVGRAVAVHLLKALGCNRQPFSCTRPEAVERDDPLCRVCAALKEFEK